MIAAVQSCSAYAAEDYDVGRSGSQGVHLGKPSRLYEAMPSYPKLFDRYAELFDRRP